MTAVGLVVAIAAATMAVRAVGAAGCSGVCKSFVNSGLDGGSYITTIAVDPSGSGVVLAGSDVGGVYRSTDLGQSWLPANTGITLGALSVASLVFSPGSPGKVYAALGNLGPGGVEVSADGGQTWTARSSVPRFNAPNRYTGARPSAKVLATSSARYLYAATPNHRILR